MLSGFYNALDSFMAFYYEWGILLVIGLQFVVLVVSSLGSTGGGAVEADRMGNTLVLTGGTVGTATATGFLETLNLFAPAIGILLTSISVGLAGVFYFLNYRLKLREQINVESKMRKEFEEELKSSPKIIMPDE